MASKKKLTPDILFAKITECLWQISDDSEWLNAFYTIGRGSAPRRSQLDSNVWKFGIGLKNISNVKLRRKLKYLCKKYAEFDFRVPTTTLPPMTDSPNNL